MTSIEISCLPGDLPEYIEVDIEELNLGDAIHISGLKLADGLSIPSLQQGADHDHVVVSVNAPKRAEELDEEVVPTEGETTNESDGDNTSGSE
jgi:large subunit ribosomal protein L25